MIDGGLWDRPDDDSPRARERSRLYNASTLVTLMAGVLICYLALYVVNVAWAFFVLDPAVMGGYLHASLGYGDLFVLAWFVASAATVGGGLGSGLESDEAIRAAAYPSARRTGATVSRAIETASNPPGETIEVTPRFVSQWLRATFGPAAIWSMCS